MIHKACASEYLYYGTPTPWLHVKLLKFLQLFPPPADGSQREKLDEALERIMTKTEVSTSVNKSNADHCILFEAVNVIIHHVCVLCVCRRAERRRQAGDGKI